MQKLALSLGCAILTSTCLAQTANWVQVMPANSPSMRNYHLMSYDFITQRVVLFGGRALNDTWEYDGSNWTRISTTNAPPARDLSEMVYDGARLQSLLFGGQTTAFLSDTWVYSSIQKNWTQLSPQNSPPGRFNAAMAYDLHRARVVLFGGWGANGVLNDTWEWDGTNWSQVNTANAPAPRTTTIVYDSARRRIVLQGGWPAVYDTWEYDGSNWTQVNTTNQPTPNCCIGLGYDAARQRVVMFGGFNGSGQNINETWEYDGRDWTRIQTATSPPARRDQDFMVYDSRRGRMVVFGGTGNSGQLSDTWEYVATPPLAGSPPTVSIATGGKYSLALDAGTAHAGRLYWVFGSVTGTSPGVTLASAAGAVNIPLNPDIYTDLTIGLANSPFLANTRGVLDNAGKGSASVNLPMTTLTAAIGLRLYHAYLVYDSQGSFFMASNPVTLTLVK